MEDAGTASTLRIDGGHPPKETEPDGTPGIAYSVCKVWMVAAIL